jgi:hypothetical protein
MTDYIKLYEENASNPLFLFFIVSIFCFFVLTFSIYSYFETQYWSTFQKAVYLIVCGLILLITFTVMHFQHFGPDTKENLANVKKYNVKSVKNLGKNIKKITDKYPYIENSQINKILNEFYQPKGNDIENKDILKELEN